jgi:hypothetical protein
MRSQFILSPGIGVHEPRRFCADRGGGTAHFNATSNRLSSLADFSPRGICFSSAARKCGCPILSLGKGGTKSPPLHSFVIPRGHQSAGDLLSVCRHQPAAIRSSFLAGLSPRGICFSSAARKCGCPILFPLLGKSGIWRHHGHEWVQ